jgi:hypothetical protein
MVDCCLSTALFIISLLPGNQLLAINNAQTMEPKQTPRFAFGPRNYRLMWLGLAVLAAGFITMTLDSADYGEGFLGITLGPILLAVGFIIEFWAIMAKPGGPAPIATDPVTRAETTPGTPVAPQPAAPVAPAPSAPTYKRS